MTTYSRKHVASLYFNCLLYLCAVINEEAVVLASSSFDISIKCVNGVIEPGQNLPTYPERSSSIPSNHQMNEFETVSLEHGIVGVASIVLETRIIPVYAPLWS